MSRRSFAVGALFGVLVVGCSPGGREAAPLEGNWRSDAWGTYLSIIGDSVEIFEYSAVHCFSVASGGARGIGEILTIEGTDLLLQDAGRTVRFDRLEFLPEVCLDAVADDAPATFEVLAATIEEHYLPGVDPGWAARAAAPGLAADAGDPELFDALTVLLGPLARPDVRVAGAGETWVADPPGLIEFPEAETFGDGGILGGSFDSTITYLAFRRLSAFDADPAQSLRIAADAIDRAIANVDSLVLDLRGSDGGSIDHAMLVASRIVGTERVVAELEVRGPDGFAAAGDVTVRPLPTGSFKGRVAVLVGPGTIGVAELLVAAIDETEGVTIIGRRTSGSPGPGMVRFLPNGWSVGFPNLRAVRPDGTDLSSGIAPDLVSDDPLGTALELLRGP